MYSQLRNLLFFFPAERVHYFAMNALSALCSLGLGGWLRKLFQPRHAEAVLFNRIRFPNLVGLGAGFDKNARYLRELETLGFGFVEIGTVTPKAQEGNPKPRLFRLKEDEALINRMGFNNEGIDAVTARLKSWRLLHPLGARPGSQLIIGGNIGKNKATPNEEAWKDYEHCFRELHPFVDYFVVNVSSPNTPGLRELQEKESLRKILKHLQMINNGKAESKPILLKIAPDLEQGQVDDVIDLALEIKLDGLVISNTTISRSGLRTPTSELERIGAGGLSGKPVMVRSTELVRYVSERTGGSIPLIASGGIFTAADAGAKRAAGAHLVQVWTGFIYEGPRIVRNIVEGLA